MGVIYVLEHPNHIPLLSIIPENKANGTIVHQKGDTVTIITWYAYSPEKKSGRITTSQWRFYDQTKKVILQFIGTFSVARALWENPLNPETCLPDRHKRIARKLGGNRYNKQRFRGLIIPKSTELKDINETIPQIDSVKN